jgi:hypothetical protein
MILMGAGAAAVALAGAGGVGYAVSANATHSTPVTRITVAQQALTPAPSVAQASVSPSASPSPVYTPTRQAPAAPEITDPWAVVSAYYGDIESGNFSQAWNLLSPSMQERLGPFGGWEAGYSCTSGDSVSDNWESGDTVNVDIISSQCDGSNQYYTGSYTVDGGKIISASVTRG